ncbi:uncharacterized protein LOC143619387 [Bidens hawaiensis]|uniref:uncharacterized protein LOC143619387 n=1 Tax=Bidens hawaiensis TaxID=980011 RepID=UPI0040493558
MDCSHWMYNIGHFHPDYFSGVQSFLKIAEDDRVTKGNEYIPCPCIECKNFTEFEEVKVIQHHLITNGFMYNYTCWLKHGESLANRSTPWTNFVGNNNDQNNDPYISDGDNENSDDDSDDDDDDNENSYGDDNNEISDYDDDNKNSNGDEDNGISDGDHDHLNENDDHLKDMFDDLETNIEKPVYAGCENFSKLGVALELFNLKENFKWSDTIFTSLLSFLHALLPKDNELPVSLYQAKKLMCPMGLKVGRIHACLNDRMLFRNEFEKSHKCVTFGASRYKCENDTDEYDDDVTKNGPPAKLLWYLPIIPRLKCLFANAKESKLLRWHAEERKNDGKLRHVTDSPQWRNIIYEFQDFGDEIRNLRFGLSSDGINPFGIISSRHNTWPVLLCIYNLPPWLCMKRKYIMMSLIQGPLQPGNDIDVYLSPLINDTKMLWSIGMFMMLIKKRTLG